MGIRTYVVLTIIIMLDIAMFIYLKKEEKEQKIKGC